jgi:hypothetical protein
MKDLALMLWCLLIILAGPVGFVFGALHFGFIGAIVSAVLALAVVMVLPFLACYAAASGVLYLVYLLVVYVAS